MNLCLNVISPTYIENTFTDTVNLVLHVHGMQL